ncbi:MAG: hypothetical protein AAF489_05620 [Bacteroidota bacterium]
MKKNAILIATCFAILLSCDEPDVLVETTAAPNSEVLQIKKQSVVFIAGFDENEDGNNYYANASAHFKSKNMQVVESSFSLEEIIAWLSENKDDGRYDEIHIVSHSNAWRGMSLLTVKEGDRITKKTLTKALEDRRFPKLDRRITRKTNIIFHSCGLGENDDLLQLLQIAFSSEQIPQIYASPYFNVFGGKYASHYLAQPYYVYYPTAQSQGPIFLAQEISASYPGVKINWLDAIKSRSETKVGSAYSHRFNIPVDWEITFEKEEDVPQLKNREAIMDWIAENEDLSAALYQLSIPIEKFRWTSNRSENRLRIMGKTTVVSVLQPITNCNDNSEYEIPNIHDSQLYHCL